ncbi:MAG: Hsp70 family protein [Alphaproteobacteria bacterium]
MNLLTIEEPKNNKEKNICLGIDFGTTNSVCSVITDEKISFIKDEKNCELIPTLIYYKNGIKKFGNNISEKEAVDAIKSIKRNFLKDPDNKIFLNENEQKISTIEVAKDFFIYLKSLCDSFLKLKGYDCVLTVPAYYDEKARSEIMRSAFLAGFNIKRLINEPTSAAFAYGIEKSKTGTFFVYDLGGGTFDISVLKLSEGVFKVLGTSGDPVLGGDDFDFLYSSYLAKKNFDLDLNKVDVQERKRFIGYVKKIKENFESKNNFEENIKFNSISKKIKFKKEEFNESIYKLVDKTINISKSLCDELNITDEDVDGIILVGGSTRCEFVKEMLKDKFSTKIYDDTNPDLVVSRGASLHGNDLINGSKNLLLDVTPLSLGIETMGGLMEKVISRNTPIPAIKEQTFTTSENGQTSLKIKILQGERETSENNISLGEFVLSGLDPKPAGIPRIIVRFSIDVDGILVITAIDESTGMKENLVIKTDDNINIKDLKEIVESSIKNAEEDVSFRMLIEWKIKAKKIINEIHYYQKDIEKLCEKKNIENISNLINMLQKELNKNDKDKIEQLYKKLNKETEFFAEKKIGSEFSNLVGQNTKDL